MKKTLAVAAIFAMSLAMLVTSAVADPPYKDKEPQSKVLLGKVLDAGDNPLAGAVVYLTNTHTRAVKTYIVGPDGAYRFPALQPSLDYEVYAQFNNRKSGTKTVSQFDDRTQVYISLKINTKAEAK